MIIVIVCVVFLISIFFPSYDWHQTGSQVVISMYAKCVVPEQSSIEANQTNVSSLPIVN